MSTAELTLSESERFGRYDSIRMITVFISSEDYIIYRLQKSSSNDGESYIYSVLVSLHQKNKLTDEELAPDVARDEKLADKIFSLLYENSVTPATLFESIDEIFDII